MPYLKDVCQLTDFQSTAVQSAFFGAYFLMSLPAGWVLKKLGYQRGIVTGLLVMAGGALLFIPAADSRALYQGGGRGAGGVVLVWVAAGAGSGHSAAAQVSQPGAAGGSVRGGCGAGGRVGT
nr:hypothetical protein [Tanacetum cinerariifolium]